MDIPEFSLEITPKALNHIHFLITELKCPEDAALVMSDKRVIGSGYEIKVFPLSRIKDSLNYICLFEKEYKKHGFPIFVDTQLISERYLPRRFVIDILINSKDQNILDVKNPIFETY